MPYLTKEKIAKHLQEIGGTVRREARPLGPFRFIEDDPPGAERPDFDELGWRPIEVGEHWGGYDVTAWFRTTVTVPDGWQEKKLALRLLVGPRDGGHSTAEAMLYADGRPLQGIDTWHEEAWLPPEVVRLKEIPIALRAWSGVLGVPHRRHFKVAELVWIDERAEGFFHLAEALRRALAELDENDWRYLQGLRGLHEAFLRIDFAKPRSEGYYASLGDALAFLSERVAAWREQEPAKPTVVGVGHAHIDLAWLWRLVHAREKAQRTFATVLNLMRQYPEYRFLHSAPQAYRFLEEDSPELFEGVREQIDAGRWEVTGGMWVEADVNLPSGESLIRQLLFGKRYVRETFGREMTLCWLPDVFGYSWALPQILKGSGIESFMTTKISWSQFNRFPHDTFHWRGIDGTEILTHFITTPEPGSPFYTYNGELTPGQVKGMVDAYQQKGINDELLHAFGWGDGGGGPTKEMLESGRALENLPGLPKVRQGLAEPYFERLAARLEGEDVPVWDGELYLEYHRGTYTSQAWLKRANRKAELLYREAEWLGTVSDVLLQEQAYPDLRAGWERLLLNQFHDILPGSSIRQVYEDAREDFVRIDELGASALAAAERRIVEAIGLDEPAIIVLNALSWSRGGLITLAAEDLQGDTLAGPDGRPLPRQRVLEDGAERLLVRVPDVPSLGYAAYRRLAAEGAGEADGAGPANGDAPERMVVRPDRIDTPFYRIELNERGQITSLYDKEHERRVIAPGELGNVLQAFEDKPLAFDAWDIDPYYVEKMREVDELVAAEVEESGPLRGVLRLTWRFLDSTITQRLTVYAESRRIEFRSEVDWQERQILLKAAFPTTVRSTRATYEIQFGSIERPTHHNTSWDWARFEVVAHRWVDLSEGNYGVALLNDCKYGHDVRDHVMRLTLIKSAIRPDETADRGRHVFTYALLPHAGGWREGRVPEEGHSLNTPLRATAAAERRGPLPDRFSFVSADAEDAIIDTVKRSEDGDGWIVRVYEGKGDRCNRVVLTFGRPLARAAACNLVEEGDEPVPFEGARLSFALRPFEIRTFRVAFAAAS